MKHYCWMWHLWLGNLYPIKNKHEEQTRVSERVHTHFHRWALNSRLSKKTLIWFPSVSEMPQKPQTRYPFFFLLCCFFLLFSRPDHVAWKACALSPEITFIWSDLFTTCFKKQLFYRQSTTHPQVYKVYWEFSIEHKVGIWLMVIIILKREE